MRNAERGLAYAARIVDVAKSFDRSAAAPTITATLGRPFPTLASQASGGRAAVTADGAVSAASGGVPVGSIVLWPAPALPTDWLTCDGTSLLRSAYPALFAVIGTTYGAVDGTHFSLPDFRGRVPVGLASTDTDFDTLGQTTGAKTATPSAHAVTQPAAHTVTQPAAHANHVVTQPSAHAALAHSAHAGAAVSAHVGTNVSAHAGAAVAAHSSHSHELPIIINGPQSISNIDDAVFGTGTSRTRAQTATVTSVSGSYPVAKSQAVSLSAHSVTQPSDHAITQPSDHSVTQPGGHSDHAAQSHSGTALDAHSAHSGTAVSAHTGAAVGDHAALSVVQPSLVAHYVIKAA